jgi:hypothetical protein
MGTFVLDCDQASRRFEQTSLVVVEQLSRQSQSNKIVQVIVRKKMGACVSKQPEDPVLTSVQAAPVPSPTASPSVESRLHRSETVLPGDMLRRNYDLVKQLGKCVGMGWEFVRAWKLTAKERLCLFRGAYATVYEGMEKTTSKFFAVKIIDLTKLDMTEV